MQRPIFKFGLVITFFGHANQIITGWLICRNMPVKDLIRSQLRSEEDFRLCIAVNFKSLWKESAPSFDFPFGTVMTKLKLFHVVERKMCHARQTFEITAICEFDEKFDI